MADQNQKPLPKSLHTVKVLNLVTRHNMTIHDIPASIAMEMTLNTLGLQDAPDVYGLKQTALKQIGGSKS